jgi:hypothetical protein
MPTAYYTRRDGYVTGPLSADELRDLIADGTVGDRHEVATVHAGYRPRSADYEPVVRTAFWTERDTYTRPARQSPEDRSPAPPQSASPAANAQGPKRKGKGKAILRVVADLAIAFFAAVLVDEIISGSGDEAGFAAGLIVFSFVLKGWLTSDRERSENEGLVGKGGEGSNSTPGRGDIPVIAVIGLIAVLSLAGRANRTAERADDEAYRVQSQADRLNYEVQSLESDVRSLERANRYLEDMAHYH